MSFPSNPNDGDTYGDYFYDAEVKAWRPTGSVFDLTIDDFLYDSEDEFETPVSGRVLDIEGGTLNLSDGTEPSKKGPMRVPGVIGNSVRWDGSFFRMIPMETNLVSNGDCESTTPPAWVGNSGSVSNSTFVRSTDYVYEGTYSYKLTAGSTSASIWNLMDTTNSYNGMNTGDIIRFEAMCYVPAGQTGVDDTNLANGFVIANRMDFSGSPAYQSCNMRYVNTWEKLVIYFQIPYFTEFDGFRLYFQIEGLQAGTVMYVDSIKSWRLEYSRPTIFFNIPRSNFLPPSANDFKEGGYWNINSAYSSNARYEYDEEIDDIVYVWNKGSSGDSYIYQNTGLSVAAAKWNMSFWFKCNYSTTVSSYVYGPAIIGPYSTIKPNVWTRVNNYVDTTGTSAGVGFQLSRFTYTPGGGYPSDVEFKITQPFVHTEHESTILKPKTTASAPHPLELNEPIPPVGTFMCWLKPGFAYDRGGNVAIFADYVGGTRKVYFLYSQNGDSFRCDFIAGTGGTTVTLATGTYSYNSEIQQWFHLALTWDSVNHYYALYENGVLVDSSTTNTGTWNPTGIMSIGCLSQITNPEPYYINSSMADVLLDDRAWNYDEIRNHYVSGKPWKYEDKTLTFERINNDYKQITYNTPEDGGKQWRFQ